MGRVDARPKNSFEVAKTGTSDRAWYKQDPVDVVLREPGNVR